MLNALCLLIFVNSVYSVTFKNVTLETAENITTIPESDNINEYLPDHPINFVFITGKIPVLYENSLGNVNVREIYLLKNEIEEINPGAFENSTRLEILEINFSNFTTIRRDVFNGLKLKRLKISNDAKLEKIEEGALDNPHILTLDLSFNAFTSFEKNVFEKIPNLKFLILSGNKIDDVAIFNNLSLEFLDLSKNQISTISQLNLTKLVEISLSFNRIQTIGNFFKNHSNLIKIDLSHNQISSISSDAFDNLPQLKIVDLSHNKISKIDNRWFQNCQNVTSLHFGNNLIEEIPSQAFKNVQVIELHRNRIKNVSNEAFKNLRKIMILDLSENEIETWTDFLRDVEFVDEVFLSFNKIKCVGGDFEGVFKAMRTYLIGNPLEGECLRRIFEWEELESTQKHRVCKYPSECRGRELDLYVLMNSLKN